MDKTDEDFINDLLMDLAGGNSQAAMTKLKASGMKYDEAKKVHDHLYSLVDKIREEAGKKANRNKYLSVLGIQLLLLAAAGLCFLLFGWVYELSGCILGLSISGTCIVDSVLLTAIGSAGLTAIATCLMAFRGYFE